jgi:hypothetical protein
MSVPFTLPSSHRLLSCASTKMQHKSNLWPYMKESPNQFNQLMPCLPTATSLWFGTLTDNSFGVISGESASDEVNSINFHVSHYDAISQTPHLTLDPLGMGVFVHGPASSELEHILSFNAVPSSPIKQEQLGREDECLDDMNITHCESTGPSTRSNSFSMYNDSLEASTRTTSCMSTLTQRLFGSEVAETGSSWSGANDSPTSFFPNKQLSTAFELFDLDRHSQSPSGYSLRDLDSPNRMRVQRKMMVHGIQQNTTELQRAQIRSSRKRSIKSDPSQVDVVRRTMCTCDYLGCHKAFRRNEHLKRHKQT